MPGANDLLTVNSSLEKDWDYEKILSLRQERCLPKVIRKYDLNDGKKPEDHTDNRKEKIWWVCKRCGNQWVADGLHMDVCRG